MSLRTKQQDWRLVREMERAAPWSLHVANKSVCILHLSVFQQTLTDALLDWTQTHSSKAEETLSEKAVYSCLPLNYPKSVWINVNMSVGTQKLLHRHQKERRTLDLRDKMKVLFEVLFIQCIQSKSELPCRVRYSNNLSYTLQTGTYWWKYIWFLNICLNEDSISSQYHYYYWWFP